MPRKNSLSEFDQLAVSRAAAICALELAKEEAVLAAELRIQRSVVDDLLAPVGDMEALRRRAIQAGVSETGPFAVAMFSLAGEGTVADANAIASASDALNRRAKASDLTLLTRVENAELTVLCDLAGRARAGEPAEQGADAEAALALAEVFRSVAVDVSPGVLSGGVGRPAYSLDALYGVSLEARDALRIGRRVHGDGLLVRYAELGLYRVLHVLRDSPELRSFYEQTLGPLTEYDRRTGQNLIETLEAYFECHGNLSQTAQKLHHHRNSLLYRIGRIQEISGLDLEDSEARLSLQVALKARRMLQ